jgi:hypothetical protein
VGEVVREAGGSPLTGMPPSVPGGIVQRPPPLLDEHGAEIRLSGWDRQADTPSYQTDRSER